ncbi:carbon-monoxide dehydrogenase medium subunit [Asanoa iriomotensis]|uniref:Carbon-monoxide dehydrogenase medium subunit n=2 Tax=Asanoa iriomotensis TaxID=234613 RepID=A0ABQ4CH36_9ACTN|nr:carbon-monoxide dehydrogenase medium subunit [Asanoa iriomotensis]
MTMEFLRPSDWDEAVAAKAAHPDAVPIAGGTDVMVDLNFDRSRPGALLDLTRVTALTDWGTDGDLLRIGAGVTYRRLIDELAGRVPGLAMASRTVGSPQIRNRGTVGGNLGSASPAGDAHPALLAAGALVELASVRGTRRVPVTDFFVGPKRSVRTPDELIAAYLVPADPGVEQFAKVGTRNAMVIAVCSFALSLDATTRTVGTGIGSAGPTPLRATEAADFLAAELPWESLGPVPAAVAARFGELVGAAARPIDDVRGRADYRRHALAVLARRTLGWAWADLGGAA